MVMVWVAVVTQPKLFVVVNVTVFVPAVLYNIPAGFSAVEEAGEAPAPNAHEKVVPAPVLPVFVKLTAVAEQTGAVDVNETVGDGLIVMICELVITHPPGVVMVS